MGEDNPILFSGLRKVLRYENQEQAERIMGRVVILAMMDALKKGVSEVYVDNDEDTTRVYYKFGQQTFLAMEPRPDEKFPVSLYESFQKRTEVYGSDDNGKEFKIPYKRDEKGPVHGKFRVSIGLEGEVERMTLKRLLT